MTDIFIKSFNRPFYLDRCIASLHQYISGDFKIIVLDDGTPEKYLDKIRKKYPDTEIRLSENYEKKIKAIDDNITTKSKSTGRQSGIRKGNQWPSNTHKILVRQR